MSLQFTSAVTFGAALALFVGLASGVRVNFDAHARGSRHPAVRGVLTPPSGIVPFYCLLWWRRGRPREYPPSRLEKATAIVVVAGLGGLVAGSLVSPPDPTAQLTVRPVAFACCPPDAYRVVGRRFDAAGDEYTAR